MLKNLNIPLRKITIGLFSPSLIYILTLFFLLISLSFNLTGCSDSISKVENRKIDDNNKNKNLIGSKSHHSNINRFINFETGANVKALAIEGDYLWLGMSNGIIRYDTRTLDKHIIYTSSSTSGGLLSNGIYKIKIDSEGNKWIGTYGGGLSKFDGVNWTTYTPYGGGLVAKYGKDWEIYPKGKGLGDLWVYDMAFDKEGRLWIATWKGASLFDGKSFKTYTTDDGLIDKWVYSIVIDKDGIFWFGTEGGVTRYDGKIWASYTHADGLGADIEELSPQVKYDEKTRHHSTITKNIGTPNPNYVLATTIDKENNKWFGTWGAGLSKFNGKRWKTYTAKNGLGGNFVHVLKVDKKGRIWAGTDGGVSIFDGKRWKTYTTKDGLLDNNVFSIAFDNKGNKWIGTWKGLSKLERE